VNKAAGIRSGEYLIACGLVVLFAFFKGGFWICSERLFFAIPFP
jgi:hypothetical protein